MKISINWIKEFVNLDGITPEELIRRFNLATAEIEGYEIKGKDTYNVVFGKILEVKNHPESNHLHILKVDVGKEVLQIVCGAPNVRVGMVTAVALVGGCVAGHKINPAKLVGVDSYGMCCSAFELGIGGDDEGIMDITEPVTIGQDIKEYLPIDDVVFEIDNKTLTNRPDLWGHYGLAREFSVIFNRPLRPIETDDLSKYDSLPQLHIKNNSKNCFRYSGISVDNITIKKSPLRMAIRLYYAGMRDINLLADITNYIMLELGQPMHAFDHDVVHGIEVIEAKKGDTLLTLEGENHEIPEGAVVITDDKKVPVAIAGIKGGLKASISDTTKSVLFESATFDSVSIRKTSRAIGLVTDASQRYEKSLDPEMTPVALARLLKLLKEIDPKAKVSSRMTDCYTKKYTLPTIEIDEDFISNRIGERVERKQIVDILTALGFGVSESKGKIVVKVPSYRATKDVSMKEDLVEEVARIYGYDNITPKPLDFEPIPTTLNKAVAEEYNVKQMLAIKYNACEVHTYLWNYADFNQAHHIESPSVVRLMDSSLAGQSGIRSALMPTLLKVVSDNRNQLSDIRVFEVGRVAPKLDENNLVAEEKRLCVVLASQTESKEDLIQELRMFIVDYAKQNLAIDLSFREGDVPTYLNPYNSAHIVSREGDYGYLGLVHPKVCLSIDKRLNIAALEVDFGMLASKEGYYKKVKVPSKFQSVNLDVSILTPNSMKYGDLEQVLNKYRSKIMNGYRLYDIYEDSSLGEFRSITIRYELCGKDHTLEGKEIDEFLNGLVAHLAKNKLSLRQ